MNYIIAGNHFIIFEDGKVYAIGYNSCGQLGIGHTKSMWSISPVLFFNIHRVNKIFVGLYHSIAIIDDNSIWAWGCNNYGQLGIGNKENQATPFKLNFKKKIVDVALGGNHSLALTKKGCIYAWGNNTFGQLGIKGRYNILYPKKISFLNAEKLFAGYHFSMALTKSGELYSWGDNNDGQLGTGKKGSIPKVVPIDGIRQLQLGNNHCVALTTEGKVFVWGSNDYGQLGNNTTENVCRPIQTLKGEKIKSVHAGGYYSIVLLENDSMKGCGSNLYRQLGMITKRSFLKWEQLPIEDIKNLFVGEDYSIFIKENGVITCGINFFGIDIKGIVKTKTPPVLVPFLSNNNWVVSFDFYWKLEFCIIVGGMISKEIIKRIVY